MHEPGRYEFIVMLAVAVLSFLGAPIYIVAVGAILLMLSTAQEYNQLHLRFTPVGSARLVVGAIASVIAASLAFSALCFVIGKAFAWLIA